MASCVGHPGALGHLGVRVCRAHGTDAQPLLVELTGTHLQRGVRVPVVLVVLVLARLHRAARTARAARTVASLERNVLRAHSSSTNIDLQVCDQCGNCDVADRRAG